MYHEERVEAKAFHGCAFVVITFPFLSSALRIPISMKLKIVLTLSEILTYNRKEFLPALALINTVLVLHHSDIH